MDVTARCRVKPQLKQGITTLTGAKAA